MTKEKYRVDNRTYAQIIDDIVNSIENYNIGDIKFIAEKGKMIAAFLLCGCLIDLLAHYRYDDTYKGKKSDLNRFSDFIDNYFPSLYNGKGNDLYSYLRCTLVHNYSTGGKLSLGQGIPQAHYNLTLNGAVVLDIDEFIKHVYKAWEKYKQELKTDPNLTERALKVHKEYPILILRP